MGKFCMQPNCRRSFYILSFIYHPDSFFRVHMKSIRIQSFPAIQAVSDRVSFCAGVPFNIGTNIVAYRNGNDGIGYHADNTQNEDLIYGTVLYSENQDNPRRLKIRPNINTEYRDGDEQIELFPMVGDGYCMDGTMQKHYVHSIPKSLRSTGLRLVMIQRNGSFRAVKRDNGTKIASLLPPMNTSYQITFGNDIPGLKQGHLYTKTKLVALRAHGYVSYQFPCDKTSLLFSTPVCVSLFVCWLACV